MAKRVEIEDIEAMRRRAALHKQRAIRKSRTPVQRTAA